MQKHSTSLISELIQQNHQLTVFHSCETSIPQNSLTEIFGAGKNLELYQVQVKKTRRFPGHYIKENNNYSSQCYQKIKSRIDEFDLIYIQGLTGKYFFNLTKSSGEKIPTFLNLHGFEMFQKISGIKNKIGNFLLRRAAMKALNKCSFVLSFGAKIDDLILQIGIKKDKIIHQSNAIGTDWINEKPLVNHSTRTFIFIGRNERRKGIVEIQEALKIILNQSPNVHFKFHFVGPVFDKNSTLGDCITYHGEIRDTVRMKEILMGCDCILVPSYSEGMPTVILEAMATGLVTIATDVGAVNRVVDSTTGILITSPKPQKLVDAMLEIINLKSENLLEMKKNAKIKVKNSFTWKAVTKDLVESINDRLSSK